VTKNIDKRGEGGKEERENNIYIYIYIYILSESQATIKAVDNYHTNFKLADHTNTQLMWVLGHRRNERNEIFNQQSLK
jgi:ribonuclease HI